MKKLESPNDVLKHLPPIFLGTWGGLGILPPLQPPALGQSRIPLARITEGTILHTEVFKFMLRFQVDHHIRFCQPVSTGGAWGPSL